MLDKIRTDLVKKGYKLEEFRIKIYAAINRYRNREYEGFLLEIIEKWDRFVDLSKEFLEEIKCNKKILMNLNIYESEVKESVGEHIGAVKEVYDLYNEVYEEVEKDVNPERIKKLEVITFDVM